MSLNRQQDKYLQVQASQNATFHFYMIVKWNKSLGFGLLVEQIKQFFSFLFSFSFFYIS